MPYKSMRKPLYKKKRTAPRRAYKKRSANLPEWGSGSFTRPLQNPSNTSEIFNVNQIYSLYDIAIDQFPRASLMAQAHQQYRITKVALRFKPLVDTFTAGGAETVPSLFHLIDKAQSVNPLASLTTLKNSGCVPKRMDDKMLTVRWSPGVIESVNTSAQNGGAFAKVITSPWLNTTADPFATPLTISSVDHKGILFGVEQVIGQSGNYMVDLTIEVQFRKAAFEPVESSTQRALACL